MMHTSMGQQWQVTTSDNKFQHSIHFLEKLGESPVFLWDNKRMSCLKPKVCLIYSTIFSKKKVTKVYQVTKQSLLTFLSEYRPGTYQTIVLTDREAKTLGHNFCAGERMSMKLEKVQIIDCGNCIECGEKTARNWATRVSLDIGSKTAYFWTLTYSEDFCPRSLQKRDLKAFLSVLRHDFKEMRYFAVGEYGDKSGRPHYHVLTWNHEAPYKELHTWDGNNYVSDDLKRYWQKGIVTISPDVEMGGIRYCAGYVTKKLNRSHEEKEILKQNGLLPEFKLMSKDLTKDYYLDHMDEIIQNQGKIYLKNGDTANVDRYFIKLLQRAGKDEEARLIIEGFRNPNAYLEQYGYDYESFVENYTREKLQRKRRTKV